MSMPSQERSCGFLVSVLVLSTIFLLAVPSVVFFVFHLFSILSSSMLISQKSDYFS
jgi:signal peptidase I